MKGKLMTENVWENFINNLYVALGSERKYLMTWKHQNNENNENI